MQNHLISKVDQLFIVEKKLKLIFFMKKKLYENLKKYI